MLTSYKYCVVIPYRNIPCLLKKCLSSVPQLPYIHVLIIDNSDKEQKANLVLADFKCHFGGLTIIECEPRGIGYVRNEGLRFLREQEFSGLLVFADADDYFTLNAKSCFEQFEQTDYDLVFFTVTGKDEQGNLAHNADYINRNFSFIDNSRDLNALRFNYGPVWGKFIDFNLIVKNDLCFQEIESCEDTLFSAKLGFYSQRPYACETPIYEYVQRPGSLVMTANARKSKMGFEAAYDTTQWLLEKGSREGYYWTQFNVIWHWGDWCQRDAKAWLAFCKVLHLCKWRDAFKGAASVLRQRFKVCFKKFANCTRTK